MTRSDPHAPRRDPEIRLRTLPGCACARERILLGAQEPAALPDLALGLEDLGDRQRGPVRLEAPEPRASDLEALPPLPYGDDSKSLVEAMAPHGVDQGSESLEGS